MDNQELRQLAVDIADGKIFGTWDVKNEDMIPSVFMIIPFLKKEQLEELQKKEVVQFYEYISKAGPMAVNGMPTFFSANHINKDDWKKLVPLMKEFQAKKEQFMEASNG